MYSEVQRLMIDTQPTIIINITDFGDAIALCYLLVIGEKERHGWLFLVETINKFE